MDIERDRGLENQPVCINTDWAVIEAITALETSFLISSIVSVSVICRNLSNSAELGL